MINEGWTLNDVIAFAKEYKLNLTVYDSNKKIIPNSEYSNYKDIKVISQSRPFGDAIIENFNFYININTEYIETEQPATSEQQ